MKKTNLLVLLFNLSPYELNKLKKFIVSPYFNKNAKVIDYFNLLKSDIRTNKVKEKDFYFKKIYQTKTYDDQKFRNLNSDLFQLTLKFLAQEGYEKDTQAAANYLIQSVKDRELNPLFEKAINKADKWMDINTFRDGNYFLQKFNFERNIFNLTTEYEKKTTIKKNEREITVLKINDNLDYFYMIEKLKYYNWYLSSKTLIKSDYEFPYIDRVLAIVKMHQKGLPPALQIYYEIYKTSITSENHQSYEHLKILIPKYIHLFDPYEAKGIYEALINYTIKQVNRGNTEFYGEMMNAYTVGLDSGAIFDKGYLSPTSFRNICSLALRMNKIQWAKDFIEQNIKFIQSQFQENAMNYNKTLIYFYEKNYKKVIETVQEVEFEDPLYTNVSKSMVLVSYYELYNEEALMYYADSFTAYMRRSTGIPEKLRRAYLNLIKYTKKLSQARYDKKILPKLKKEILNTEQLASKQWFLEKLKDVKLPDEE